MIRKVMAGAELKRQAGTVIKKLSKWLAEEGHISEEDAMEAKEEGASAARDLPMADRAAYMLYQAAERVLYDPEKVHDDDYLDFDHYTVVKIEPGKLWFAIDGGKPLGPVSVPKEATALLRTGWDISCAFIRIKGKWSMIEAANVYP